MDNYLKFNRYVYTLIFVTVLCVTSFLATKQANAEVIYESYSLGGDWSRALAQDTLLGFSYLASDNTTFDTLRAKIWKITGSTFEANTKVVANVFECSTAKCGGCTFLATSSDEMYTDDMDFGPDHTYNTLIASAFHFFPYIEITSGKYYLFNLVQVGERTSPLGTGLEYKTEGGDEDDPPNKVTRSYTWGASCLAYDDESAVVEIANESYYDAVIIEDLPEWGGNIQIGSEQLISYANNNFCYLDSPCFFNINYGYEAIGGELYLYEKSPLLLVGTSTLPDQAFLRTSFEIDDPGVEEDKQYCLYYFGNAEYYQMCDISIEWIDMSWCAEATVCEEVATTSEFIYGVQCGFRTGVCWLFQPSASSLSFFSKNIQNFEESFPFNLVFGLINEVSVTFETSTTTGAEFGIPWISTTTGEYKIENGIDMNSYNEILGVTTTTMITDYTKIFVWVIMAVLIVLIIVKFSIL